MTCIKCQHPAVKRFGTFGPRRVQRYRCHSCKSTFSESKRPITGHYISVEKASQIITLMMEGMSIRAIARVTDTDKKTILSLLLTVGKKCRATTNTLIRNLTPNYLELDELWCFTHCREKHVPLNGPREWGDTYTWTALDRESKLIVAYLVGKRDQVSAYRFINDLRQRVASRCQITSDGLPAYRTAIERSFGADVDFAQLVKVYGTPDNAGPDWYGPAQVVDAVPTPISGNPDMDYVSTSHVERSNLTVRMHLRRYTRLTNAHSKKLSHLQAAVDILMAWYNLVRVHQSIRMTPAMQAGITNHIWTVAELITK